MSRDTIRFYEGRGLLGVIEREPSGSGYKDYGADALTRLCRIRYLKGLGFTLAEISEGLDRWVAGALSREDKRARVEEKLAAMRAQALELERTIVALELEVVRLAPG